MGTCGTGLYDDDVACDVKEEYLNFLRIGMRNEEATIETINANQELIGDDEETTFWLALADTQWNYGRLIPKVKKTTIQHIEKQIAVYNRIADKKLYEDRKRLLNEIKEKLQSEQPIEKKISKLLLKKANWKIGDILLYQIVNEDFKEHKWYQKYVLLKVVGVKKTNIGSLPKEIYYHEDNIISLYNWVGSVKPNLKIIETLRFILIESYEDIVFGKREFLTGIIDFTKRELNNLNIKVIGNTLKKIELKDESRTWYSIHNFDETVIEALEMAKTNNILVDETNAM